MTQTKERKLVGNWGLKVGDDYSFDSEEYVVVEIGLGDLANYCWIEKKEA